MNKIILVTGTIVGVAYLTELFIAWYSGYVYEQFAFFNRAAGPYWWSYFGMMFCNVVSPQFFWSKKLRRNIWFTFFLSIVINIGMWFERFVIIATTLARDYLPSSWSYYSPTWVEMGIFAGTFGLFFVLYLIFTRVAPVVAIAEVKSILKSSGDQYIGPNAIHHDDHHGHGHDDHHKTHGIAADDHSHSIADSHGSDHNTDHSDDHDKVAPMVAAAAPFTGQADDLKKIEGIGPKIESILNDAGIHTWNKLSTTEPSFIKEVLTAAGNRYKMHDPSTWPDQAKLADEGKWDELDELQDRLDGGRV